jgi:multimeric flavodoxin WrbA
MGVRILGVSGSPVPNSNTDRAVKAVLEASGLESEFVKLSDLHVRPCLACKACVSDNICKQKDDFPELAKKVKDAEALVIGAYVPYGQIDGFTKAFLERLWSMRHVRNLNKGKLVAIVVNGTALPEDHPRAKAISKMLKPRDDVINAISQEMRMENMKVVGSIKIMGNLPCLTCGEGADCKMSGARELFGPDAEISSKLCVAVEDQPEVWEKLNRIGKKIGKRLSK